MNIAIVGCGLIGQKRAKALGKEKLVACVDQVIEKAEVLAKFHSLETIQHAVSVMQSYDKPIKSTARFLEKALDEGWQASTEFDPVKTAKIAKEKKEQEEREVQLKNQDDAYLVLDNKEKLKRLYEQSAKCSNLSYYRLLDEQHKKMVQENITLKIIQAGVKFRDAFSMMDEIIKEVFQEYSAK